MRGVVTIILCLANLLAVTANAQTETSQIELAQRIYELSYFHNVRRLGVDQEPSIASTLSPPFGAVNEGYIEVQKCKAILREFGYAEEVGFYPYFYAELNLRKIEIATDGNTGQLYHFQPADSANAPNGTSFAAIQFDNQEGAGLSIPFRARRYTTADLDPKLEPFELAYDDDFTSSVIFGMYDVANEDIVRDLVAAIQEYKETYCQIVRLN